MTEVKKTTAAKKVAAPKKSAPKATTAKTTKVAAVKAADVKLNNATYATGKRKDSVARVYLFPGKGNITVNDVEISKYFPSSQICSSCGFRFGKRDLGVRTITCPNCGAIFDRDVNAACNIRDEGLRLLRAS